MLLELVDLAAVQGPVAGVVHPGRDLVDHAARRRHGGERRVGEPAVLRGRRGEARAERHGRDHDSGSFTYAVYGDAPYGCKAPTAANNPDECPVGSIYAPDSPNGPIPGDTRQIEATPAFIAAINHDPKVSLVLHAGDIHSGSTYCTLAYDQTILDLWSQFKDPLVYTPGDNEWTDCQKSKEGGGVKNAAGDYVDYAAGHPVANLALVRAMFFPEIKTWPAVGRSRPRIMRMVVDLPAPLGPRKPTIWPRWTSNVTP